MSLLEGFLGGLLIGLGAAIALLGAGEIMGFSGIITSVLTDPWGAANDPTQQWKLAFLSSFLLSAYVVFLPYVDTELIASVPSSRYAYALSGLLVGLGTKVGNGCTSGHGICNMARLSKRSISAVLTFMATAIITAIATAGPSFDFLRTSDGPTYVAPQVMATVTAIVVALTFYGALIHKKDAAKRIPGALSGMVAAAGLSLSSMVYPAAVKSFLDLSGFSRGTWDATLMFVMTGGLLSSLLAYQFVPGHAISSSCPKLSQPLMASKFGVPTNTKIDGQLLFGAATFGVGWGVTGVCPGPALLLTMTGLQGMVTTFWPAYFVGAKIGNTVKAYL